MNTTMAIKLKMEKVEFRNRILKIRNRALKKRLEKCVDRREKGDSLVKKCEIHELHIDMLERKYLEKATLLREAHQEIERLNAVVTHYEHQITSYSQRSAGDVGEYFEMVVPQTPLNNSVCVSAPSAANEPNENLGFGPLNIEIKTELTDEMDNASLWSRKVARENLKRFDPNYRPKNDENGIRNWECQQDDRWSVFKGDEGRESETEGEEQNGEVDDDNNNNNNTENEEPSEGSKICRWIQHGGKPCGHVSKGSELTEHFMDDHLGLPGPDGYVCQWERCKRNRFPVKLWNDMMLHMESHSCKKQLRCARKGCRMVFRDAYALKRHEIAHRNNEPVKCTYPECTKVFRKIYYMAQHLRQHEECKPKIVPSADGFHVCDVPDCGRAFKLLGPFRKHVEKHKLDEQN